MADIDQKTHAIYDTRLEGLRGLCALIVMLAHFLLFNFFHSFKIPGFSFFAHLEFAHEAVLIFFVISGYVMGINHLNEKYNFANVVSYLKKRALRLYPIYLIALLISFTFDTNNGFSVTQLIGHLFFTQEFLVKTISSNTVLWSLSYEVVYYILFLGLWKSGKNVPKVCLVLSIAILIFISIGPELTIVKSVLIGWLFWMMGLFSSQQEKKTVAAIRGKWGSLFSYFSIILSIHFLGTGQLLIQALHFHGNYVFNVQIGDLLYLLPCFIIIVTITGRSVKYLHVAKIISFAIPAFHIFLLVYFRHHLLSNIDWVYATLYFVLAVVCLPFNFATSFFEKLNNVGRISYALYTFHFPVFYFLNIFLQKYLSGFWLLFTGLFCWAVITIFLSVGTERVLQPRIKKYFFAKA
ncbi:acyltransferase family protein [Mucilaginibacter ginsenosidivorax]|uniref:Acyltransferase n=1 Tax=Mucilaginibacter ginsenosidivorax TaxID=862126 RepID=A0A5B8W1M9_9SPHI|nr:acyltransferase [Mucilaginibacter ginsenosidivorax]QEC77920.1 acyltransferase [Mucilaginibacter ginsenosidivorax]